MSPLMYACQVGHFAIAEVLLSLNAEVNYQDSRGWTVSKVCFLGGFVEYLTLIIM